MTEAELPQSKADEIEWKLLSGVCAEYSRGDLATDWMFDGTTDVDGAEIDLAPRVKDDRRIDDCFDHLQYRLGTFDASYAFKIDRDVIAKRDQDEDDSKFVYRFLLACSRPGLGKRLSLHFTEICKLALQRYLGSDARVWNIDAGSADRQALGGSTRNVSKSLAPLLGAKVVEDMWNDLPRQGGDGGADLVACFSFEDKADGALAVLGQCAASSETDYWKDKIHQPIRFRSLYHWAAVSPVLATFIPVVYRKANGTWLNGLNAGDTLLFDRIRILRALKLDAVPLPAGLRSTLERAITVAQSDVANGIGRRSTARKAAQKRSAAKKVTSTLTAAMKAVIAG